MSDEANNPEPELALETESAASDETAPDVEVSGNEISENNEVANDLDNELDNELENAETAAETPQPEYVSVEYDGEEYEVPPQLKDALLRQSDYTQKTQSLAEQRKAVQAAAAHLEQQQQFQQQTFEDAAAIKAIDQQIEQYKTLNWQELYNQDTAQASILNHQKQELESQRQQLENRLKENQTKALESQRVEHARILEEGQKVLKKEIENWNPQLAQTIAEYGISQGLDEAAVARIVDPVHVKLIDKARRYDELVAKQKAAMPKAEPPKSAVKVKGKRASATKDPDKLSTEQWLKMRNAELQKRKRA